MLLHGEQDTDVPFQQSVLMAEALKHHNVHYEFITDPNWNHVFDYQGINEPSVNVNFRTF